jgi:hypothetical protein
MPLRGRPHIIPAKAGSPSPKPVIPAKAGIWLPSKRLQLAPEWQSNWVWDSGFRRNDEKREWLRAFIFPNF